MKKQDKLNNRLVSVIIPTYNYEEYIYYAVSSALDQTYKDIEIIVVDDGSTDRTSAKLQPVKDRVQYLYQDRKGVSAARNLGIQMARGEYVAFLDADDLWYPEKLEIQMKILDKFPGISGVFSDFSRIDANGMILSEKSIRRHYGIFNERNCKVESLFPEKMTIDSMTLEVERDIIADLYYGNIFGALFRGNFIPTPSLVMQKKAIENVEGFDVKLKTQEDYDLWLRLAMRYDFAYLDYPLLSVRKWSNQLTADDRKKEVALYSLEVVKKYSCEATTRLGKVEVNKRIAERYKTLGLVHLGLDNKKFARSAFLDSFRSNKFSILPAFLYVWSFLPTSFSIWLKDKCKTAFALSL